MTPECAKTARGTNSLFYSMRLVSQVGQGAFLAGLFLLAGKQDQGALGVSTVLVAMMGAAVLIGLPGGALADRLGPRRAVTLGAVGRTAAMLVALVFATQSSIQNHLELLAVAAFFYSAVSQLYCPAELALVSTISPGRPSRAHAILVGLQYAGQGIGVLVLSPLLFWLAGVEGMIGGAAALYLAVISFSLLLAWRLPQQAAAAQARHAFSFGDTFSYFVREPGAAYAGLLLAFGEVAARSLAVVLPRYVGHDMGLSHTESLALAVPGGFGALLAMVWAGRRLHVHIAPRVMRWSLVATVLSMVALAVLGNGVAGLARLQQLPLPGALGNPQVMTLAVALPVAIALGASFALGPIGARAFLSSTAPRGQQARVFAMQSTFTDTLVILPLFLAGIGTEIAGTRPTFLFVGLLGAVVLAVAERPSFNLRVVREPFLEPALVAEGAALSSDGFAPRR